jgi:hypothetical protein
MNFCRTEIYAGTPLEARLRAQGRLQGDYWGYDYRIPDPQAQRLFDVVYPVFRARNYGQDALHHRTMGVDYEYHLLSRFVGSGEALGRRVRDYIVRVNLNTCRHLSTLVRRIERDGAERDDELVRETRAAVERDNRRLGAAGERLLDEIRRTAREGTKEPKGGWLGRAVAAGLAASVTLATAEAGQRDTQPFEMAPARPGSHIHEPAPRPNKVLRAEVVQKVLPLVVERVAKPGELELGVQVAAQGHVLAVEVRKPGAKEGLGLWFLPGLQTRGVRAGGAYSFGFSAQEVKAALEAAAKTESKPGEVPIVLETVRRQVLPALAKSLKEPVPITLTLWVNPQGRVSRAEVRGGTIPQANRKAVTDALRSLSFKDQPKARGKRFELRFQKALIQFLRKPPTQIYEMIAPPSKR